MHKNTLKKPNFQLHPNSLSPTRQENTILSSYATAKLLGIISNNFCRISQSTHTHTHTHIYIYITYIYIYICYFIKSAVGIPNTTCIRSISVTELGLVGLMRLWQNSSHTSRHINNTQGR